MKRIISFLSIFAFLFISCDKKESLEAHIPDDAHMLLKMNTSSMFQKVAWEAVFSTDLFDLLSVPESQKETFNNFQNAGLDWLEDAYVFMSDEMNGQEFALMMQLKNVKDFKAFLEKEGFEIENQAGIAIANKSGDYSLAFSDKIALMIISRRNDFVVEYASALLTGNYTSSQDEQHKEVMSSSHDVSFMYDYERLIKSQLASVPMDPNLLSAKDFEGDLAKGFIDFNDGEIVSDIQYIVGESKKEMFANMQRANTLEELMDHSTAGNAELIYATSFNFAEVVNLLNDKGLLSIIDKNFGMIGIYGTSSYELLSLLDGDIMFYLSDVEMKETVQHRYSFDAASGEMKVKKDTVIAPSPVIVAAVGINNEERLNEIMQPMDILFEEKEGYKAVNGGEHHFVRLENGQLLYTNKEEMMLDIVGGKDLNVSSEVKSMLTNNNYSVWTNGNSIGQKLGMMNLFPENMTEMISVFDDVVVKGNFEENQFHYEGVIKMSSPDENSLFQILNQVKKNAEEASQPAA